MSSNGSPDAGEPRRKSDSVCQPAPRSPERGFYYGLWAVDAGCYQKFLWDRNTGIDDDCVLEAKESPWIRRCVELPDGLLGVDVILVPLDQRSVERLDGAGKVARVSIHAVVAAREAREPEVAVIEGRPQ